MGGSDYYQTMLTRGMVANGVEVEVLATRTFFPRQKRAFFIQWPNEGVVDSEKIDGANVSRKNSISPPSLFGRAISKTVTNRWKRESKLFDPKIDDISMYVERALTRPHIYNLLAATGRGPISPSLIFDALRKAKDSDVILAGFCPFSTVLLGCWVAQRTKKPFVVLPLFHPEDVYHHFENFYRCFILASAVLTQTPYSTDFIQKIAPGSRVVEVGAGVDPSDFSDDKAIGDRFRQKYKLQNKKIVLFVGRKERHKNYQIAIDAIDLVTDDNVELVMIGADVDGEDIESSRVRYLGPLPRSDLVDAYDACELFIFPSIHESFGIVLLEAWMRAKPVLGYAQCLPVASIIDEGENGFLCENASEFSNRINLLIQNPNQSQKLGRNGKSKVLERYTWEKISKRVENVYEAVVRESRFPT